VLLQPDVDVYAVGPHVDEVHIRQITLRERALLSPPLLGKLRHHRTRQSLRRTEELTERRHEITRGQAVQVQQRQHLGDLRGLPRPRRQDRRGEALPLAGVGIGALVVDPRHRHLDRPGGGEHLARLVVAVAHHQPTTTPVALAGEPGDIGVHLGLQCLGQHPPGTLPHELIDQRRTSRRTLIVGVAAGHYGEHGRAFPTDAPTSALLENLS
jgi:hypothetical protein